MRLINSIAVPAGISAIAMVASSQAFAQDSLSADASYSDDTIVVTARRRDENIQDVPLTVGVVSGDTMEKLALTQFQDVVSIVPGLSLDTASIGSGGAPAPSIRGVSFDSGASFSPTVDIYMNDVPIDTNLAFQAIYDIGALEILRGPQGTLRGRTAPSGALTLTTRRADLSEVGGYINLLGTDRGSINAQAAIGLPIIKDVLALRVAGVLDESDGNFVKSIAGGPNPYRRVRSGRATLTFHPAENFDASVTYQYLNNEALQYNAVEGPGASGGVSPLAPAGYNGPAIRASDRRSPTPVPNLRDNNYHIVTGQVNWEFSNHKLSYVGSYFKNDTASLTGFDPANSLPGIRIWQNIRGKGTQVTQEVRLSSTGSGNFLDYTVGGFYSNSDGRTAGNQPAASLPGAFGSPGGAPDPTYLDQRYVLPIDINFGTRQKELSFFGSTTAHVGPRTELTVGGRYIISKADYDQFIGLGSALIAIPVGFPCGGNYPDTCDFPIVGSPLTNLTLKNTKKPFIYNASISHRFSDQLLAYATTGTSWRRGGTNYTLTNLGNDPVLADLLFLKPEKSTSYEIGVKTNLFDNRLRFNVAAFYQKFKDGLFALQSTPYLSSNGVTQAVDSLAFSVNADAVVKGVDIDFDFQATPNWTISGGFSYADGKIDNDEVPCRDSDFNGVPDPGTPTADGFISRGIAVALCRSNQSVSRDPLWSTTLRTEIKQPLGQVEGYVRGLLTIYPSNDRRSIGYTVPSYGLLNLYGGVRSPDGRWDVGLFARNVTSTGVKTSLEPDQILPATNSLPNFGPTGYSYATYTPPREVGLTVRYAFGAR